MPISDGSIGARLKTGRERAGLSVARAAQLLHVEQSVVLALESERFDALGAAVFARGHLRHYAELIHESASELLAMYAASVQVATPPDLTLMPHAKQTNLRRSALVVTGVAVVIGVGLIGSIRWIYLDLHPAIPGASSAPAPLVAPHNS